MEKYVFIPFLALLICIALNIFLGCNYKNVHNTERYEIILTIVSWIQMSIALIYLWVLWGMRNCIPLDLGFIMPFPGGGIALCGMILYSIPFDDY